MVIVEELSPPDCALFLDKKVHGKEEKEEIKSYMMRIFNRAEKETKQGTRAYHILLFGEKSAEPEN